MADTELDYALPSPELRPFVTLFYRFRVSGPCHDDVERAQQAQLRFRLSPGASTYFMPDGSAHDAPPLHILGPTTGPVRACAEAPLLVFGMGITPTGWSSMLGSDASAMRNRVVDATALFGGGFARAAQALREAADAPAMAVVAESVVRQVMRGEHAAALSFCEAVDAWLAGAPSPALDALLVVTGLSRRQIERRCNALYGAPPKLLARRYRALRAAVMMASGEAGGAEGFYDQSHMIREVKQFTGLTPRRVRDGLGPLARMTIDQRRALDGQVHRVIVET